MNNKVVVKKEGDTITRVTIGEKEICLIGTAHVSPDSVSEVTRIITEEKPDHVCVEIDSARYKSMSEEKSWKDMDIIKILKEKKGFFLIANLMLSSFQKRMGSNVGMKPGEDMKAAVETAKKEGLGFSFCDRDVQVTLRRAWAKSNFWDKNKVIAVLLSSAFSKEEASAQDIEELKDRNELEGMMDELAKELPKVKEVLIDERDQYLATSVYKRGENKVVAVVGAGHVPGMIKWFEGLVSGERKEDIEEISKVPPKTISGKISPWVVPVLVVAAIVSIFYLKGSSRGTESIIVWFLANGTLSAFGALLALGHPLSILAAFISAPITSLNIPISAGMVAGIVEALLRKPKVGDFESLSDDASTIKKWYQNRILRSLLVLILASIGSLAGTAVAGLSIFNNLVS